MKVYNEEIFKFIDKCVLELKEILKLTFKVKVNQKTFLFQNTFYPINLVVFESNQTLGYFSPKDYTIGLNLKIFQMPNLQNIKNILTHELIHYFCYIKFGGDNSDHGINFKKICYEYNIGPEISKASMPINFEDELLEKNKIIEKAKKILNLSNSSNQFEKELALLKANELIIKHNINIKEIDQSFDSKSSYFYCDTIYSCKKKNSKISTINRIIDFFMVKTILFYKKGSVELEAVGSKENIEFAKYLVDYIESYLDSCWEESKKLSNLKGLRAKNNLFYGIGHGFVKKQQAIFSELDENNRKKYEVINNELMVCFDQIFSNRSKIQETGKLNAKAFNLGTKYGEKLNIHLPLKNSKQQSKLLTFFKNL